MSSQGGYRCNACGEWHDELPRSFHVLSPVYWSEEDEDEDEETSVLEQEHCVIADEHFFIRGLIRLPVLDDDDGFEWGAWVSLSRVNYIQTIDDWQREGREEIEPMFGWLGASGVHTIHARPQDHGPHPTCGATADHRARTDRSSPERRAAPRDHDRACARDRRAPAPRLMSAAELAARLPDVAMLRRWCRSLAVLDAVMSPDEEDRYYRSWDEGQQMASMRNGSGDEYSIVFSDAGAYIRGFDHESDLSPWSNEPLAIVAGLVDDVPASLREHIDEPAFSSQGVPALSVCLWREAGDPSWSFGSPSEIERRHQSGGAEWLFDVLDGHSEGYVA